MKTMVNYLRQEGNQSRRIVWISTREEPTVYINGMPYVLRSIDSLVKVDFSLQRLEETPFDHLRALRGIQSLRLEALEIRLKQASSC